MSSVLKICIANEASAKPILQKSIFAVKNKGIEGDRYYLEKGTWSNKDKPHQQISLIESENIDFVNSHYNNKFEYEDFRRNIITKDIKLNQLIGKKIIIGNAEIQVIKLRHPCIY